ncbi:MAG TPA: hypothetical protein VGN95_10985 [Pyrinomonadaceae bacterium]|jgi:hypothetical protein|nr:hypothetical protein [Pyrinomonadaceae bacterium]
MIDPKLKTFIDEKIEQIKHGPEICFGLYVAPGLLPDDKRLPVKITQKEFAFLTVYLSGVTGSATQLSTAVLRFDTFVKGQPASVGGILVYNRRAVEELMRETNRTGNATMLVSNYAKNRFTEKGGFFMLTADNLKKG